MLKTKYFKDRNRGSQTGKALHVKIFVCTSKVQYRVLFVNTDVKKYKHAFNDDYFVQVSSNL